MILLLKKYNCCCRSALCFDGQYRFSYRSPMLDCSTVRSILNLRHQGKETQLQLSYCLRALLLGLHLHSRHFVRLPKRGGRLPCIQPRCLYLAGQYHHSTDRLEVATPDNEMIIIFPPTSPLSSVVCSIFCARRCIDMFAIHVRVTVSSKRDQRVKAKGRQTCCGHLSLYLHFC